MPYDKNLDAEIFKEEHNFEGTRITVGVFQYNEGEKKLQLGRQNVNKDGELGFTKLGRLRKEEAEAILPSIQKAIEHM
jgi:hypothetical protein